MSIIKYKRMLAEYRDVSLKHSWLSSLPNLNCHKMRCKLFLAKVQLLQTEKMSKIVYTCCIQDLDCTQR